VFFGTFGEENRAGVELGGFQVVAVDLAGEDPVDEVLAGPDERLGLVAGRLAAGLRISGVPGIALASGVRVTRRVGTHYPPIDGFRS